MSERATFAPWLIRVARIWLLADAFADIEAARQWYETQQPSLGDEFVDAVDNALEPVVSFPVAYPVDFGLGEMTVAASRGEEFTAP